MKAITQRESVVAYIKSCLISMLISKYRVISPLRPVMASFRPLHRKMQPHWKCFSSLGLQSTSQESVTSLETVFNPFP